MSFPRLEEIPVTTMVVIVSFEPLIDIDLFFPLLTMTRFKTILKNSKKVALPLLKSGSLLSARYKGVVLGDVQFVHPRFFKNSITVDMSTTNKNVNVKISKGKLHMCGIKNISMVHEATNLIFAHVVEAEKLLSKMEEKHLDAALEYVNNGNEDESCLEGLDKDIMEKLIYYATKCTEIKQFTDMIDNFRKSLKGDRPLSSSGEGIYLLNNEKDKLARDMQLIGIRKAMANYNFSLGFKVNRGELAKRIDGVSDFTARYNNTIDYSVTVEHPHSETMKRKKDSPHVTFTVYRSGILTISGPHHEIIDPIYEKFIKIIESIRPHIELAY
ncbi:Hypothetical protein BQ3484_517 [Cedratvirus A11]|uniref:Uncharacterized protein n=1 Tax=Cedratvirus A11 TaxID=1903266 RepID=A0A1M7XV62_9VIRU|nr:Hypothetical protein BQ3484_517 [Cedratvirus A11]SHO33585.1 Hypothetical protein BQ3484_517 [Cedratvirus A11]